MKRFGMIGLLLLGVIFTSCGSKQDAIAGSNPKSIITGSVSLVSDDEYYLIHAIEIEPAQEIYSHVEMIKVMCKDTKYLQGDRIIIEVNERDFEKETDGVYRIKNEQILSITEGKATGSAMTIGKIVEVKEDSYYVSLCGNLFCGVELPMLVRTSRCETNFSVGTDVEINFLGELYLINDSGEKIKATMSNLANLKETESALLTTSDQFISIEKIENDYVCEATITAINNYVDKNGEEIGGSSIIATPKETEPESGLFIFDSKLLTEGCEFNGSIFIHYEPDTMKVISVEKK